MCSSAATATMSGIRIYQITVLKQMLFIMPSFLYHTCPIGLFYHYIDTDRKYFICSK